MIKPFKSASALAEFRKSILAKCDPKKPCISVCCGTGCRASESVAVKEAFEKEIAGQGIKEKVNIRSTGCHGFCEHGPVVVISPKDIFYEKVKPENVAEIVRETIIRNNILDHLLYTDPTTGEKIKYESDIPFYKAQQREILGQNRLVDPINILNYIIIGGYKALAKVLFEMGPEDVINEIKKSQLRGRGGAGFPTGFKWEFCRKAKGDIKYIICNADEGDPGAYMDRSVLEGNPHLVIEGMIVGAYAIGSHKGFVYVRQEYPLAVSNLKTALEQARARGLLGKGILGSKFDFDIHIECGAGAFVCGEETALIASLEGKRGEPKQRPPFPVIKGLWGKPTNINNVETWANIPAIIKRGADWYSKIGTDNSKGTKIFSLVGKVKNTGLVEVPMGTTLRKIMYDIGGGIKGDKDFKAVQTGGPSGGCLPRHLLDLPIDYESLAQAGSIMGSGGMIVMDEATCMVDISKYFLNFLREESCGKCLSCREGTQRMWELVSGICDGTGTMEDLKLLEELAMVVKASSMCGLGQTASNPVLSTLRYFRNEYEAHIKHKRCSAAVCRKIISSACQHTCPLEADVPAYVTLIAKGQVAKAAEVIRKTNPLPNICARVCHHPCERKCVAGEDGDPVAIKALKRFATDHERAAGKAVVTPAPQAQYEKVAIVGSGPAGLTAGHALVRLGYDVTVFEASSRPGGMPALTIPEYRLPWEVLNFDIDALVKYGVKIKTDTQLGRDITVKDIFKKGYKAVFLAMGAHKSLKLGIPGEDSQGVLDPLEFLRKVKFGEKVQIGEKVGIIGGGNAAIDAARTALKAGAKTVTILYRRTKTEMPAFKEEIEEAIHEGVRIEFLTAPVKVISTDGKLTGLECIRMQLSGFDKSGRRRPVPVDGSEFTVELDTAIPAISQQPETKFLYDEEGIKISSAGAIQVNPETLATDREGVFAGGDAVTGPATVTEAMAAGKIAAESIHRYLRGVPGGRKYEVTKPNIYVEPLKLSAKEIEKIAKMSVAKSSEKPSDKKAKVTPAACLNREAAIAEAKRCLRCDLQNAPVSEENSADTKN